MKALIPFICLLFLLSPLIIFDVRASKGKSMYPTLDILSLNFCKKPEGDLTGKIVTYVFNSTLSICHRVISDMGDTLLTRGDNNPKPDSWTVYRTQVTGEVIYSLSLPFLFIYVLCIVACVVLCLKYF